MAYKFTTFFKKDFLVVTCLFLAASSIFSILSLIRHFHFQSQGVDFAIYDQALWLYSKLQPAFSTINFRYDLADRFRPIMIPLSLIYVFTDNESALFIFQAVIVSAAIFPIWLIAKKKLFFPLSILPSFLFIAFVGIQSVFIDDFHEVSLLPVSIAWLFYFLEKKRWRSYFVALFLCLSVREHVGFLLSVLATYIYFSSKNIKAALSTFMVSLLWSVLAIKVFMPSFGKVDYSSFVTPGDSLFSASMDYLLNPLSIARNLFYPLVKIKTIVFSFLSFGLLPLLDLKLLPIIGFQFAYRFLDIQHPIRSTLFYHFSVELAVLMSISTISVLEKLTKIVKARRFFFMFGLVIITLNTIINIYLNAPVLTLLKSNFYADEPWMKDNKLILSKIPKDQSVSAQNNLVPHLSHREKIYVLPIVEDAQYIVFDLHPNQDNWNFFTLSPELAKNKLKELIKSGSYRIAFSSNYSFLLEKMPSPAD